MQNGQDVLEQALRLLNYTDSYEALDGEQDTDLYKRGLAAVNQIYCDLWYTGKTEPFFPLNSLGEPVLLSARQVQDVMPFGVAMLLAMSEGDGDNQQLYATLYNRKRMIGCNRHRRRLDVLFRRRPGEGSV